VLGLAALLLPHLGAAPLERAEIYFLDGAREMLESGDWVVPRSEGKPFFDKPVLTYWLMAASMARLGPQPGAARLVPAVAALGVVLATVWLGTLVFDRRSALAGGLVLATTLAFLTFGRVAMADMLLALSTTLAVALGVRAYRPGASPWTVPLVGAVLGLGFLTKGPVALLVPGLAMALLLVKNRACPLPCGLGSAATALVAFAVTGLGWFLLVYRRMGTGPLAYFFLRENLERFAGDAYDVGRPFWFYPPAYLAEGLPWSPFLPLALWRLVRAGGGDDAGRPGARLLAAWVALVLVPLSLSRGKVDYYLLPLYPALSLIVGRYFAAIPWRGLDRGWARGVLVLATAAIALFLLRPPSVPEAWLPGAGPRALLLAVLFTIAAALSLVAVRPTAGRVAAALAASPAVVWRVLVAFFLPAFAAAQPNRAIAADVARERLYRPNLRLAYCSDPSRARRDILLRARLAAIEQCDMWSLAASRSRYLLLVTPAQDASFRVIPHYRHVATYRYLPATALTLEGLFSLPPPGEILLGANFRTTDPIAERERKREYRKGVQRDLAEAASRARSAGPP
jgi:4-amino-4-deoxy-L-arabinose transferase-like glycosyltransferase